MSGQFEDRPATTLELGAQSQAFAMVLGELLEVLEPHIPSVRSRLTDRVARLREHLLDAPEHELAAQVARTLSTVLLYVEPPKAR